MVPPAIDKVRHRASFSSVGGDPFHSEVTRRRRATLDSGVRDFLYRLVARLHDGARPLSRNQHFHVFDGSGKRALRIDRHLRDLESQLTRMRERGERPRVRLLPGGGTQLVMRDPKVSVVRTATLTPEEAELLRRHPAGAWALGEDPVQQGAPGAASGEG